DLLGAPGALDDRGVVLVHDHLLGAAEVIELEVLELDAEIFRDRLAAGHGRDVLEHALRRSPKPGALTAQHASVPRSLFTTRVSSASPSRSSARMRNGLPARATCSSNGSMSFITLSFFSWIRMTASSSTTSIRSGFVTK